VMPTGFSFNMDGTAIYMTIGILFLAHAMNIHLSITEQFTALPVMLLTSKGAAGVTGGGFVALAATLPAVNLVPVVSLALLVGVDRFMAEIRAATNLTSNVIATLVVARWMASAPGRCWRANATIGRRRRRRAPRPTDLLDRGRRHLAGRRGFRTCNPGAVRIEASCRVPGNGRQCRRHPQASVSGCNHHLFT